MLPSKNRLRSADFKGLRGARVFHSPHFFIRIARGAETGKGLQPVARPLGRAAAVVSSAVAKKAVQRNLLRRRIYAVLRGRPEMLRSGLTIIQAKKGAPALSFAQLQGELSAVFRRV